MEEGGNHSSIGHVDDIIMQYTKHTHMQTSVSDLGTCYLANAVCLQ